MPLGMTLPVAALVIGVALVVGGVWLIRASGAHYAVARRLGGARQLTVAELLAAVDAGRPPQRPIRLRGRIRCPDPIVDDEGNRLVAVHRDVEVLLPDGRWRLVERLRESRPFELWDHAGGLAVDAASAGEPLVVLPGVWEGDVSMLPADQQRSVERLAAEHGPIARARATTRAVSVVDTLLVLSAVGRDAAGRTALRPPAGGYVICALPLDEAMRVLAGPRRRQLLAGWAAVLLGIAALLAALIGALIGAGAT